jgi:hypothetical protein
MGLVTLCLATVGCHTTGPDAHPTEKERLDMLSLMLPEQIEILPFTRITSFDADEVPDGLQVVIQPTDRFGDPVKAVGYFYFELWTHRDASADRKGERLAYWDRSLTSADDVKLSWTHARMYEFQLAWTRGLEAVRPNRKYILIASYRTPWDETIQDEYVINFALPESALTAER